MIVDTIIIQAGGFGTRMGHYTQNKPKCLIPYLGKTIIENNLNFFKNKKIIIITDYLSDILVNYITSILKRQDIIFVKSTDKSTSSGIDIAIQHIDSNNPFALIWSDLYIQSDLDLSIKNEEDIIVGITDNTECRWKIKDNKFIKETTSKDGVIGLFLFKNKNLLSKFDYKQSLVNNLQKYNNITFKKYNNMIEIGDMEKYESLIKISSKCRFFNEIIDDTNTITKKCINHKYSNLIKDEILWYNFLCNKVNFIPKIITTEPLVLEKINGDHLYNCNLSNGDKHIALNSIIANLKTLHELSSIPSNDSDIHNVYYTKTFNRISEVSSIIPFYNQEHIKINNKLCLNPFHINHIEKFKSEIHKIKCNYFNIIHGDITFSNILFNGYKTYFIDPRGSFGNSKIYGDKKYDWAKLYYSLIGNYDSINSKKFKVSIKNDNIELYIYSNGFENYKSLIIDASNIDIKLMELLHCIIWLSLTGYVKEDIDAIFYSFYKGIELWNLVID